MTSVGYTLTTWILPVLASLIFHELAHGFMALALGDNTAKIQGRLTLNPQKHIDWLGTLCLPLLLLLSGAHLLFGWAKPVPVSVIRLRHPRRDMGLIAAAGPALNILLALFCALGLKMLLTLFTRDTFWVLWTADNLKNGLHLSLALAAFNLVPILPLDGGRILLALLPVKMAVAYQKTQQYGLPIFLGLIFILPALGLDVVGGFMRLFYHLFFTLIGYIGLY